MHKSRKLKRLDEAYTRKRRAQRDYTAAEHRFEGCEPPSKFVAADCCADFNVVPGGWLYIHDGGDTIGLSPPGAYALYQLLDRAFGKD